MKGAFMKKHICAMALTLALAVGGLSLASDLKMADGHILPLGNEMTIREADKSYVGKELQKEWNQEKVEKEILPAVRRMGLFGKGDTVHEKMMAEQLRKTFYSRQIFPAANGDEGCFSSGGCCICKIGRERYRGLE